MAAMLTSFLVLLGKKRLKDSEPGMNWSVIWKRAKLALTTRNDILVKMGTLRS